MKGIVIIAVLSGLVAWFAPVLSHSKEKAAQKEQVSTYDWFVTHLEKKVLEQLKDPDSAKFADVHFYKQLISIYGLCGAVNAKNEFGGYVGYRGFVSVEMYDSDEKKFINFVALDGEEPYNHKYYEQNQEHFCHNE